MWSCVDTNDMEVCVVHAQRDNLTVSSSAASEMMREDLLFLRYERRLPLTMKGITMEGV